MPEVTHAGEHHRYAGSIRSRNYLLVTHRSAGLDDGGDPGRDRCFDTVGEGEERIRRKHRAKTRRAGQSRRLPGLSRLGGGDLDAVDAAHLTGADADRRPVTGEDDRVGFDVLRYLVGEQQISDLGFARPAASDGAQLVRTDGKPVALLHEYAARQRAKA